MKRDDASKDRVRRAYSWWLRELSSFLTPKRTADRPWRVLLFHTPEGLEIFSKANGSTARLGVLAGDATPDEIAGIRRLLLGQAPQDSKQILLRLSPADVVQRTIQVPRAAADLMDSVVENKIETIVAWPLEASCYSYRVIGTNEASPDQINTNIVATTNSIVRDAVERARAIGLLPCAVDFAPSPEAASTVELKQLEADPISTMARRLNVAFGGVALASLIICAFGIYQVWDLEGQYNELDDKIAAVTSKVEEVKRLNEENAKFKEQRERLAKRKIDYPPVMTLIEALSRSLPDTAYLDEFEIHDNEIRIVGKSADPTGLIGTLESTPEFEDVRFSAPTTREDGQTLGTFSIVGKVQGAPNPENSQ